MMFFSNQLEIKTEVQKKDPSKLSVFTHSETIRTSEKVVLLFIEKKIPPAVYMPWVVIKMCNLYAA